MKVVIIGAGFGGIGAAIELRRHGFDDVTILERAPEVGGTWWYNSYPGCVCDVPSYLYSFSFAQRRDLSRMCSPHDEILSYLQGVARDHGVDRLVEPNTDVTAVSWDDDWRRWAVSSADGRSWEADAVIVATGQLHQPAMPKIEGIDEFAGHSFHSSRWDHGYDLHGKRVAVIGTGASAIQFIPHVAEEAAKLHVFQRTGNWFMARKNREYPEWFKNLLRRVPVLQTLRRRYIYNYAESITLM
ncbi:MAG TPA: NAD(P)/FAD-dependent oxidoreductase, partial [Solirubrobacteraceae bacterium]